MNWNVVNFLVSQPPSLPTPTLTSSLTTTPTSNTPSSISISSTYQLFKNLHHRRLLHHSLQSLHLILHYLSLLSLSFTPSKYAHRHTDTLSQCHLWLFNYIYKYIYIYIYIYVCVCVCVWRKVEKENNPNLMNLLWKSTLNVSVLITFLWTLNSWTFC